MESKINPKETFFLHGTSEEAAQYLVREGRLKLQPWNNNPLNNHKGFIFLQLILQTYLLIYYQKKRVL